MRAQCHNHVIHWALRPRNINPVALHVLLILACHAKEDGTLRADTKQVSKLTRQPEKIVDKVLYYLKDSRILDTKKYGETTIIELRVNK